MEECLCWAAESGEVEVEEEEKMNEREVNRKKQDIKAEMMK